MYITDQTYQIEENTAYSHFLTVNNIYKIISL